MKFGMKHVLALAAVVAITSINTLATAADAPGKAAAKPDAGKGQTIATQGCAACHGADGNSSISANPKLAGPMPEYISKQLANFKAAPGKKAERENAVMGGMVAALSPDDMKNLAAFYAGQKLKPATAKDSKLASAGQKLWCGGNVATGVAACAGCHGPDGAGIPAQYPRIAGQYAEYIEAQLKAFQAGTRANDPGGMMRGVAARMTEGEMKAVADSAAGLR